MDSQISLHSLYLPAIIIGILSLTASIVTKTFARYKARQAFKRANGCQPFQWTYPLWDRIFALDFIYNMVKAARKQDFIGFHDRLSQAHPTYALVTAKDTSIFTSEPENMKALLSTKFDDWASGVARGAAVPLLGRGIFTTDGKMWSHSRAMLRSNFNRDQVADLEKLEQFTLSLLDLIPRDGSTIDLQQLFLRFTLDSATDFLFGQSTQSLTPERSEANDRFARGFEVALNGITVRSRLGRFYRFFPPEGVAAAIKDVRAATETFVNKAVEDKDSEKSVGVSQNEGRYVFLRELCAQTEDIERMVDECLSVLLAGRDTSASLLSSVWFQLARYPDVWAKLQKEVDELDGALPTYEQLRNMKYLKNVGNEVLRLFTPVPMLPKMALEDTFLPVGGGSDGKSPLFVGKGDSLTYNMYSMHRNKTLFGDNALEFLPERWEDASFRPGWSYIPFGGGPRVCIGQQFALTECYYLTIRMMQHFRRIEPRDPEPWIAKMSLTICSLNGTKVGLYPQ